ncbi:AbiJ-NTD4 domain-containing protein [Caballeronia glebae]|uniref:AbiJ-NTD4 domain-containing protein n=1 Tax=Caballeronia glebae TaxID=1777143 RepID=UPI0038BBA9AC
MNYLEGNMRFSDRTGITQPSPVLQLGAINADLKVSLWNTIYPLVNPVQSFYGWQRLAKFTASEFRKFPIDDLPALPYKCLSWLREYYDSLAWHDVYNYIEFVVECIPRVVTEQSGVQRSLIASFNNVLQRECSGYRFIDGVLSPITSATELAAITAALESTSAAALRGANEHLRTAVVLLSKKPEADYRNATKEAISAIESVTKVLGNADAPGLAGALGGLSKKAPIHPALYKAFVSLYGYASNEGGIRHALGEEATNVGFDEAKYMIVSCSAFMNYLISKADAAGLLAGK